jgi:hypothetical protein
MSGSQGLPDRWLAVLRTVSDACQAERADSVPTPLVARQLCDQPPGGPSSVRTLLRTLRRHGYVRSPNRAGDEPARWAPTAKGRAYLDAHR